MTEIDVADLDCIYLSYDEPQKEEFWVQIKNMVPWAVRVSVHIATEDDRGHVEVVLCFFDGRRPHTSTRRARNR